MGKAFCRAFEDHTGQCSSTRIMSFIALAVAIVFAALTLFHSKVDAADGFNMVGLFLGAAFVPKSLQKFAEVRLPAPSQSTSSASGGGSE